MRDVTYTEMSRTSAAFPRWSLREPEDVVGMCVDMRDRTRMLTHTILSVCADACPESGERAEDLTVRVLSRAARRVHHARKSNHDDTSQDSSNHEPGFF